MMAMHGTSDRKERSRRYYEKHKDEILAKRKERRAEQGERLAQNNRSQRDLLQRYVVECKSVPCLDCGRSYPSYVMDFDHVKGVKDKAISQLVKNSVSIEKLQAEIEKCEIVCSNCHRIRTHSKDQCGAQ